MDEDVKGGARGYGIKNFISKLKKKLRVQGDYVGKNKALYISNTVVAAYFSRGWKNDYLLENSTFIYEKPRNLFMMYCISNKIIHSYVYEYIILITYFISFLFYCLYILCIYVCKVNYYYSVRIVQKRRRKKHTKKVYFIQF